MRLVCLKKPGLKSLVTDKVEQEARFGGRIAEGTVKEHAGYR